MPWLSADGRGDVRLSWICTYMKCSEYPSPERVRSDTADHLVAGNVLWAMSTPTSSVVLHPRWRWPATVPEGISQPYWRRWPVSGGLLLRHQLLLYPVMDHSFETRSYIECASGYFLTAEMMRWFWRQYLADERAGRIGAPHRCAEVTWKAWRRQRSSPLSSMYCVMRLSSMQRDWLKRAFQCC